MSILALKGIFCIGTRSAFSLTVCNFIINIYIYTQGLHFCFSAGALIAPAAVGQFGYSKVFLWFGLLSLPVAVACWCLAEGNEGETKTGFYCCCCGGGGSFCLGGRRRWRWRRRHSGGLRFEEYASADVDGARGEVELAEGGGKGVIRPYGREGGVLEDRRDGGGWRYVALHGIIT